MTKQGSLHGRDEYNNSPNLAVLIPVIIILTILAFAIFGWLGVPWQKIIAWWRQRHRRPQEASKTGNVHDQELQDRQPASSKVRDEREPGAIGPHGEGEGGQMTPGRRSSISHSVMERQPSPWDPTKTS